MKRIILFLLIWIILVNGCISTFDASEVTKTTAIVNNFLKEYPKASFTATKIGVVSISEECQNPQLPTKNYWKVLISEPETDVNIVAWVDEDSKEVVCIVRRIKEEVEAVETLANVETEVIENKEEEIKEIRVVEKILIPFGDYLFSSYEGVDEEVTYPFLYKDKIVFSGKTEDYHDENIYLYDITKRELKQITYDNSAQFLRNWRNSMWNNLIIYDDGRYIDAWLTIYDISTEKEKKIESLGSYNCFADNKLFSTTDSNGNFYYDLEKNVKVGINTPPTSKVFDEDCRFIYEGKDSSIYVYDYRTDESKQLNLSHADVDIKKEEALRMESFDIFGDKIVYSSNINGISNYDLYLYDIKSGEKIQITNDPSRQEVEPRIYGDRIVFQKKMQNGDKREVYLYEISTQKLIKLTDEDIPREPQIYGNYVLIRTTKYHGLFDDDFYYIYVISSS